jgi:hypothetical protein
MYLKPITVRFKRDLGIIHAGLTVQLPYHFALAAFRRRLVAPVTDTSIEPDVVVTEEDWPFTEIDIDPIWRQAGVETADAAPAMELR